VKRQHAVKPNKTMSDLQQDIQKQLAKPLSVTESSVAVGPALAKRPTRVTVISWIFIFLPFFEVPGDRLLYMDLLSVLLITCGVGMLNRQNWARTLYLWLTPLFWIWSLISGAEPAELFIVLMFYVVCLRMLTRPVVSAYFKPLRPA
jgi:hypothetical protein